MAPLALPRKEPSTFRKLLDAAPDGYIDATDALSAERKTHDVDSVFGSRDCGSDARHMVLAQGVDGLHRYRATVLPYVSSAIVLIPNLQIVIKFAVLAVFCALVLLVRVLHEKAGIEVTGGPQKAKRPGDGT
jgi:hypothetical protein